MARIAYEHIFDYIKVKFECPHCHKVIEHIFEIPKEGGSLTQLFTCKECSEIFETETAWDVYAIEIKGISQESIKNTWPIKYENYLNKETELLDSAEEIHNLRQIIEKTDTIDKSLRDYLYRLLWCSVISVFDNYAHKAIGRRIFRHDIFKKKFILHYFKKQKAEDITDGMIEKSLQHQSFYQIDTTVKICRKIFMIDIPKESILSEAALIRNRFVHHLSRGVDGEYLSVSKDSLLDLSDRTMQFITLMQQKLLDIDFEIIMNNNKQ